MIGHDGVMKLRLLASFLVVAVGLGACSSEPTDASDPGEPKAGETFRTPDEIARRSAKDARAKNVADGSRGPKKSGDDRRADGGRGGDQEGAEDDSSSAYYPAAGTYVYAQSGYEEFCDTSSCNKKDLPPTQDVKTSHKQRSGDPVTVVTEAKSSDSRSTRTTTTHSPANALITDVRVKFNYQGFQFENSYQPDPPVESVRYPLRSGMSWSGMWKDSTSGDYSITVGARRSLAVGGGTVQAYPLRTQTTFRGEFDGSADVTVWIDPATAAIVKMSGELQVKSVFGSYHTEFTATLQSAPGY